LTKTALAIPALVVLVAAGAGGYQVWAQHQARAQLDTALASLPAGSAGRYTALSYNAFTQTLRIEGLAITRDGHPSLAIQKVTLHHLSGSGTVADPFQAADVRLVGTELWRGRRSLSASLVQGEAIAVLAPGVPPPLSTPSWLASAGSGTLLSAGAITAANLSDNEGASITALSLTGYADGQIQQASATGFADTNGNRIASAEAHAIDLGGLDRVFDTGRYGPGEPRWAVPRPLIGQAALMGVRSQDKGVMVAIDRISLSGFAARPFEQAPHTSYVDSPAFIGDAAAALSVGAASLSGLRYQDERIKSAATLRALSLSGYADGALAQISLDGLAVLDSDGAAPSKVTVGHFELNGLTATKLLHDLAGGSTESLPMAASRGGVRLAGLALAAVSVTPATGPAITLDSFDETETGSAPMRFTARLSGLTIPARSNPDLAQALGAIGVDPLVLDLDETGSYDIAGGKAVADPLVLTARGLGSLSISAQFTHVPRDFLLQASPWTAIDGVGVGALTIRFTNDALVQRLLALQARQAGKTVGEMTDAAKLAASFAAAAAVPTQPDAGEQVAAFIADPHSLTLTATPAAPIPFGELFGADPKSALSALNLHLAAN